MGRIRKAASLGTLGLVRWSNGSERAAKEAKRTRKLTAQQLAEQRAAAQQQPQVVYVPVSQPVMPAQQPQQWPAQQAPAPRPVAGWYVDATNPAVLRWWDGGQWTSATQPRQD